MRLSFVIPAHNERATIADLVAAVRSHAPPHALEIILVDDGSGDGTGDVMADLASSDETIAVISFRQNLGKSAALAAGLARAGGEIVFTMDADLQDDPAEIPRFLAKLEEGYDLVCGWKKTRHDPWHKTVPSRFYNAFAAWLFRLPIHDVNCGYKAMKSDVAKHIRVYGDRHRLIPVLALEAGFSIAEIPVEHHPRRFGKSNYGFERFIRGAMDVLSVWFLSRYRYSPGHFFGGAGAIAFILGILGFLCAWLAWPDSGGEPPAPTLLASVLLIFSGAGFISAVFLVALALIAELIVRDFVGGDFRKGVDDEKRA